MKTLGLLGGISWVSTVDYYKLINEGINEQLGGLNYAQCIIHSFNYADIKRNNDNNDWDNTFNLLSTAGLHLKNSGADAILLCANTMHLIADRVESAIGLPLIHIAVETANNIAAAGLSRVGLLGTKFTMELDFFKDKLKEKQIETIIPAELDRAFIHQTIFEELGKGIVLETTTTRYMTIIQQLVKNGAEGIIFGCTEIPMVVNPAKVSVPCFDTLRIHADAAVRFALS